MVNICNVIAQLNSKKEFAVDGFNYYFETWSDGTIEVISFGGMPFWSTDDHTYDWTELSEDEMYSFLSDRLKEHFRKLVK